MYDQELSLFNTPRTKPKPVISTYKPPVSYNTLEKALNNLFPQQSEENKISRTRRLLGEKAHTLSDEQIQTIMTEFQFLIDTWLNEFEKEVFKGMTLQQVFNEP